MQDSDYEHPDEHSDSEMYVLPAEETGDDSYEPPPAEQETRTVHPALPFARGEYVGEAAPHPGRSACHKGRGASWGGEMVGASHSHHLHTSQLLTISHGTPRQKACPFKEERYLS